MVSVKDRKTPRPMTGRRPWEPDYPCCSASSLVVVNPQILGSKGISSQFQMKMQGYFRTELLSIIPDQQTWISKTDYPAILKKIKRKKKKPTQVAGGNFSHLVEQLEQQLSPPCYCTPLRMLVEMHDVVPPRNQSPFRED